MEIDESEPNRGIRTTTQLVHVQAIAKRKNSPRKRCSWRNRRRGFFLLAPPNKQEQRNSVPLYEVSLMKRNEMKSNGIARSYRSQFLAERTRIARIRLEETSQDRINLWHQEEPRQGNERQTPRIGPTELRSDPKAARRDCAYLGRGARQEGECSPDAVGNQIGRSISKKNPGRREPVVGVVECDQAGRARRGNSELFVLVAGLAAGFGCAALVPTVIYEEGGGGARGERTKGGRGRGEIT